MDYSKSGVLLRSRRSNKFEQILNETFLRFQLQSEFEQRITDNESATTNVSNESSSHSSSEEYLPYIERAETFIVPVLFGLIFICGVIGNGTLILIFLKNKAMRNVPNMFICSLSIGDLLVILFCVPFTSTVYTVESWPYGLLVCKFSEFIKDVSIGVSVFTLTALSADRYFAIVDPIRKLTGFRATKITCLTIAGIWILSILIALPSALFSYIRVIDDDPTHKFNVCYPFPPELTPLYPKVMVMLKFLVYYAIPLGFIASFYIVMARHLVLSTKNMPGEAQGQGKQIQARKKVAKMVLSFVVIFAFCFFPSHVFLLWFYYDPNSEENFNEFWNLLRIIGFCLGFMNSCINPITLYCLSGTFRKHFNNSLFCCGSRRTDNERNHGGRNLLACGGAGCISLSNSNQPGAAYGFGAGASDTYGARCCNRRLGSSSIKPGDFQRTSTATKLSIGSTKRHYSTWESKPGNQGPTKHSKMEMARLNVTTLNLRSPFCGHEAMQNPPQNTKFPLTSISLVHDNKLSGIMQNQLDDALRPIGKEITSDDDTIDKGEIMTSFIIQPICISNVTD